MPAAIALRGISKQYGAVQALSDVHFQVGAGEVVALVGDNGAGKSTLVKVMAGVVRPDAGRIEFDGQAVTIARPQDANRLGIATIYQDLALCDNLDVAANLFLGRERQRRMPGRLIGLIDKIAMRQQAQALLRRLRVDVPDVRAPVDRLSGGQRQAVAIARALLGEPRVVLLDEPTAALGVTQTGQVLDLIGELKRQGHAVVVISHNLSDVFAVADRASVLRMGRNAGDFAVGEASQEQVVAAITGLSAGSHGARRAEGVDA